MVGHNVHIPSLLLFILLALTPFVAFLDGPIIHGLVAVIVAVDVALFAGALRPGEADHLARLFRPASVLLALPAAWIALQAVPLPFFRWSHPAWISAKAAIDGPIFNSISLDPGRTLVVIGCYLSFAGTVFASAACALDRRRAERMLFVLIALSSVTSAALFATELSNYVWPGDPSGPDARASMLAISGLGTIFSAAAALCVFERYETRRFDGISFRPFVLAFAGCIGAMTVNLVALVLGGHAPITFATAFGFATLCLIVVFRRFPVGYWGMAAMTAIAILTASVIALSHATGRLDLTLQFSSTNASIASMTERIMADTRWAGSGAGTFTRLVPIYSDPGDSAQSAAAPTTAAQIAIELGRPALALAAVMMIVVTAQLLRGALQRGRDSFYSAAGAGCAVLLTVEAFVDASALSTAVAVITAAILGLGTAQSASRAAG